MSDHGGLGMPLNEWHNRSKRMHKTRQERFKRRIICSICGAEIPYRNFSDDAKNINYCDVCSQEIRRRDYFKSNLSLNMNAQYTQNV